MIFNYNAKVLLFSDMCKFFIKKIDIFIKNVLKNLFIRTIFSNFAQNLNQMNAQKDFERNVKIACRKKKISQKELAKQLGVDPASLSRMIKGNPRLDTIERIAKALDVSVSALFEEIERIDGYVSIDGHIVHIHSKDEFLKEVDKSMSLSMALK